MKLFLKEDLSGNKSKQVRFGFRAIGVLIIALFLSTAAYSQITYTSADNKQNDWATASTWTFTGGASPTQPGNPTTGSASAMRIYGYTRSEVTLTVSNGSPTITVYDTLFINGNFDLGQGNLVVNSGGLLVVTGNLITQNGLNAFTNNGNVVVKGNLTNTNGQIINNSNFYVFGSTSVSGGGKINGCDGFGNPSGCNPATAGGIANSSTLQSNNLPLYNFVSATTYTWTGSGGAVWGSSGNWTPSRSSPAATDILIFNASGSNKNITSVPTETVSKITVTGNSTYSFTPASNGRILSITSTSGYALQIDNGSTLTIGSGNSLGISMAASSQALIGGQLNLFNGNFDVSGATLILHTNSAPLARTSGQVSANASTVLKFGDTGFTTGSAITLPNSIFVSAPTISSLVMNRTNGATLGDQAITVASSTFTLGNLTTNSGGRIKFISTAASPSESTSSKIIGFAEMALRNVGTGALNFLGFNMAAGTNDVGFVNLVRRTGPSGVNTFNSNQSIASSWDITTTGANPAAGRTISFSWQSAFDNVTTASRKFQIFIFNSGPGWTAVGSSQLLAAQGPPRQSATASSVKLNDTFTLTDDTQALPIELVSFTARATATSVALNWKTATEKNNDYFLVERMIAGQDFITIAKVTGAGTTLLESNYSIADEKPEQGMNYYRLKQVDFDKKFTYSEVIKAEFTGRPNIEITIYPNPADKLINFDNLNQDTWISLIDSRGQVVFTSLVNTQNPTIDLSEYHLTTGMYFIRVLDANKTQVKKLIIR